MQVVDSSCGQSLGAGGQEFKSPRPDQFIQLVERLPRAIGFHKGSKILTSPLFPGEWKLFVVESDSVLEWKHTKDRAEARLEGGKTAEIVLSKAQGMTSDPVVVKNLANEGATGNDGFIVKPSEVEAYRVGSKPFEFKGTNGFVITVDINSEAQ